jgi:hypothetical protein
MMKNVVLGYPESLRISNESEIRETNDDLNDLELEGLSS